MCHILILAFLIVISLVSPLDSWSQTSESDPVDMARFADLALACVAQEYPNKIAHVMQSDEDLAPPRELTPTFQGCFDWHSAVHGHWLLARLARLYPEAAFALEARNALASSLTPEKIALEVAYFQGEGRASFERPYGLAWLLQLSAELRQWDDVQAQQWAMALGPLEQIAADRLRSWLPKLHYPIRTGEHSQTAFALGLALDWARIADDVDLEQLIIRRALFYHDEDVACPLGYEPGGQDFLSPCLAEADLMRRIFSQGEFGQWLQTFLPGLETAAVGDPDPWLPVAIVTDRVDGKLAHLDGLNLSRAWMLEGIASALPADDHRRVVLSEAAMRHRQSGLAAVTGEHYAGGHWLGSFATYLVTRRGIADTN